MKKILVLIYIISLLCVTSNCFATQITINIPEELYPYLVTTVDKSNNTEIAKDPNYQLQTIPMYMSKIMIPVITSWKEQIEKEIIEDPALKDLALKFKSLSVEKQAELKQVLDNAVANP